MPRCERRCHNHHAAPSLSGHQLKQHDGTDWKVSVRPMYREALKISYRERTCLGTKPTHLLTREARKSSAELSEINPRLEPPCRPSAAWPGAVGRWGRPGGQQGRGRCLRGAGRQPRPGQAGSPAAHLPGPARARHSPSRGCLRKGPPRRAGGWSRGRGRAAGGAAGRQAAAGPAPVSQHAARGGLAPRPWEEEEAVAEVPRAGGGGGAAATSAAEGFSLRRRAAGRGGVAAPRPAMPLFATNPFDQDVGEWLPRRPGPAWPPPEVTPRPAHPPTPLPPPLPPLPRAAGPLCPQLRPGVWRRRGGSSDEQAARPGRRSRCGGERPGRGRLLAAGGDGCGLVGDSTGEAGAGAGPAGLRGAGSEGGEHRDAGGRGAGLLGRSNVAVSQTK